MKKAIALILALALALCAGCGAEADEYAVWRAVDEGYRSGGALLRPEALSVASQEPQAVISALVGALNSPAADAELQALPYDARILSWRLEGSLLTLQADEGYAALAGVEKTLCDGCIALTLCAVDGVSSVAVEVAGEPVTPPLSPEDLLLYDAASSGGTQ